MKTSIKSLYVIGVVIALVAYGYIVVFAGAVQPGTTLDPVGSGDCGTLDATCYVPTGWDVDVDNNYVYNTADSIGIGTATPSAILDITSTDSALLLSRIANPVTDITAPVNGMIAYDSTDNQMQGYINGTWTNLLDGNTNSLEIGNTVISGDPNRILYIDGAGNLAQDSTFTRQAGLSFNASGVTGTNSLAAALGVGNMTIGPDAVEGLGMTLNSGDNWMFDALFDGAGFGATGLIGYSGFENDITGQYVTQIISSDGSALGGTGPAILTEANDGNGNSQMVLGPSRSSLRFGDAGGVLHTVGADFVDGALFGATGYTAVVGYTSETDGALAQMVASSDGSAFGQAGPSLSLAATDGSAYLSNVTLFPGGVRLAGSNITLNTGDLTIGSYDFPTNNGSEGQALVVDSSGDIVYGSQTSFSSTNTASTDGDNVTGFDFLTNFTLTNDVVSYIGRGISVNTNWNSATFNNTGVGAMDSFRSNATVSGGGYIEYVNSILGDVTFEDAGTISRTSSLSGEISLTGSGSITSAGGSQISINNSGTGTINNAFGYEAWTTNSGSGSITNATGFHVAGYGNGLIATGTAIGFHVESNAMNGAVANYGIKVDASNAENFLAGGVRIGTNDGDFEINSGPNGVGSEVLYIGQNTIDTTAPSDERTKENILASSLSIDDLMDIEIIDFTYKQNIIADDEQQHYGVLAQQVEEVYPYVVQTRTDGYKMVEYKKFIPLLIKSIQDLQHQLNTRTTSLIDNVKEIFVKKVTTEELCINDVCFNESEAEKIKALIDNGELDPADVSSSDDSDDTNDTTEDDQTGDASDTDEDTSSETDTETDNTEGDDTENTDSSNEDTTDATTDEDTVATEETGTETNKDTTTEEGADDETDDSSNDDEEAGGEATDENSTDTTGEDSETTSETTEEESSGEQATNASGDDTSSDESVTEEEEPVEETTTEE